MRTFGALSIFVIISIASVHAVPVPQVQSQSQSQDQVQKQGDGPAYQDLAGSSKTGLSAADAGIIAGTLGGGAIIATAGGIKYHKWRQGQAGKSARVSIDPQHQPQRTKDTGTKSQKSRKPGKSKKEPEKKTSETNAVKPEAKGVGLEERRTEEVLLGEGAVAPPAEHGGKGAASALSWLAKKLHIPW